MAKKRAQGSIYRRRRNGRLQASYTIAYTVDGRRVSETAFADRAASEQLLSQRLREVARDAVGLSDPYRRHRARPLADHLAEFLAGVDSRNRTAKHRDQLRARLGLAFDGMGARRLDDLDASAADAFLGRLLNDGLAVKTRDHYATTLRQFGEWLVDGDRIARNPFRRVRRVSRPSDVTVERQALDPDDVQRLVAAAEVRPVAKYRQAHPQARKETLDRLAAAGRRRGALYLFSACTGLRRAECAGVRWLDLDTTAGDAWVSPRAATTKSRRVEPLPLPAPLVAVLEGIRKDLASDRGRVPPPKSAVFHVPQNLVEQLRKDAAYAGLELIDEHGRRLDFHALRSTCATMLARAGVGLQLAGRLMRHTSPQMTARHYTKLGRADLRDGSNQLAALLFKATAAAEAPAFPMRNDAQDCASLRVSTPTRKAAK